MCRSHHPRRLLNNSGLCGTVYATNASAPYNVHVRIPDDGPLPACPPSTSSKTPWWMVWWVLLLLIFGVCLILGGIAALIWYGVKHQKDCAPNGRLGPNDVRCKKGLQGRTRI